MAEIKKDLIVIEVSQLVKNKDDGATVINDELLSTIESVAQELVPAGAIVEVTGGE
jgi:hypothetical protein